MGPVDLVRVKYSISQMQHNRWQRLCCICDMEYFTRTAWTTFSFQCSITMITHRNNFLIGGGGGGDENHKSLGAGMAPAGILRGKVASFTLLSLRNLKRTPTPAPAPAMSLVMATNGEQPEFTSKKFKFGSEGEAVEVSMPGLKVKKLSENATIPTRGSSLAAGYDLYR